MSRLKGFGARLRSVFRSRESEARMEEEFRFHLEMETNRLVASGLSMDEAQRRARVTFGGMEGHRETMRDERGARWFDDIVADVRYALRAMRRSPGFAIATAVTLSVGIGVNGFVFGYVNSLLFRPLPARAADQLVGILRRDTKSGSVGTISYRDYVDLRDRGGVFESVAGANGFPLNVMAPRPGELTATGDMVWGEMVTENFFTVLDMRPALGRFFSAADAPQGANAFVVLSHESWRRRFASDPAVIGKTIRINGTEFIVTGVAPKGFRGLRLLGFWPEMWVPAGMHEIVLPGSRGLLEERGNSWMNLVGRLPRGSSLERAQVAASTWAKQMEAAYPETNRNFGLVLVPAKAGFENPGFIKPAILTLSSAMGVFASLLVLLVICANLANLQLARTAQRAREIAIRLAVGCSRRRLTRQLLVESAVLALPGVILAWLLVRASALTEQYLTPKLQFQVGLDAKPDVRVVVFTGVVALVAVVLFGLVPALRASRPELRSSLNGILGTSAMLHRARRPQRLRGLLVVAQLSLSVILLVAGALFVRSLVAARTVDVGFDQRDRAMLSVNVGLQGYDEARGRAFYDLVLSRVREEPGVMAASWVFPAPFDTYGRGTNLYVDGLSGSRDGTITVSSSIVGDGFTEALGVRLVAGRDFARADSAGAPPAMIVSKTLAARLWPGKDPIGQRARRGGASGPEVTVVGVVDDTRFGIISENSRARLFLPLAQRYRDWQTLIVHTNGNAAAVLPRIREVIGRVDSRLPTFGAITMEDAVSSGFSASRTAALIGSFFGSLALLIAAVGLYAVVASSVAERTREIGVRMALGSTPLHVLTHVMRGGARLGLIGLVIGLAGALALSQAMRGLLYGISAIDPVTFLSVPLALLLIVLVATYLPARRAVKLDPVAALRTD